MSNQPSTNVPFLPPHAQLIQMMAASWVSATVYTAARLALADHLADGPKSAVELAGVTGTHAPSLHRLMRTLAGLGILTEQEGQRFALTPLGQALKTGAPGCARSTLLAFGGQAFWRSWEGMLHSVQTGETGFEQVNGAPVFDYLAKHPEQAAHFSEAMVGFHGAEPPAVAAAYDFSAFKTIVDVGGATGNMLAAVLSRHAGPRGVLFDRPHVVRDALPLLKAHGVESRVAIEEGNFFESVPAGGDAYVLSHIIHDWSEEQCLSILGHCREAIKPDGRLLIVETVLPMGDTPHQGKLQDMVMLVVPGGQERTEAEYVTLLEKARFRLTRVVPTDSVVSVVEAIPI
ncbi:Multifunctional cyclase-dehydratase-3-O-methyl transferase TcmN [Luteitalea pratensis]|uniref:Multifunctional cyclase-dehydratase-3-O-methyl transferase TcmN n=1 Tax=Luteitalea pratensis TaxID=1855912 RepID=A0A143PL87_LUTPR|nr:methyltransferase [Luteitalea pratensis]AMY08980.1 Multifunctional cyclase-dehydratase-3-O-methyl transferase TcmN [Luteitalea pratensis]